MLKQTLYFENPARLNIENRQLKISLKGTHGTDGRILTRPLEDIGFIFLGSDQITLTSAVLSQCVDYGIVIACCNKRHIPSGIMFNLDSNSLQTETYRYQIESSIPLRKRMWQQTVTAKISNQAFLLRQSSGKTHKCMDIWARNVKSGDKDNLEARAAVYYWKNLFETRGIFHRDRYGEEPNQLLNFGYAVLRSIAARSIVNSGLHPSIGIFHRNKYNAFCLADDIMEPYRPFVDRIVVGILNDIPDASLDNIEVKKRLLNLGTEDIVIDNNRRPLMVAMTETTSSIVRCFRKEIRKIKYPDMSVLSNLN